MIKIKSIAYLLFNLKTTMKILGALNKKPQQTTQELCDAVEMSDDLKIEKLLVRMQILRIVTINKFKIETLEIGVRILGEFGINKNFPNKAT